MTTFVVCVGFVLFVAGMLWLGRKALWPFPLALSLAALGLVYWTDPLANGEGAIGDPHGYLLLGMLLGVPALSWLSFLGGLALRRVKMRASSES